LTLLVGRHEGHPAYKNTHKINKYCGTGPFTYHITQKYRTTVSLHESQKAVRMSRGGWRAGGRRGWSPRAPVDRSTRLPLTVAATRTPPGTAAAAAAAAGRSTSAAPATCQRQGIYRRPATNAATWVVAAGAWAFARLR